MSGKLESRYVFLLGSPTEMIQKCKIVATNGPCACLLLVTPSLGPKRKLEDRTFN